MLDAEKKKRSQSNLTSTILFQGTPAGYTQGIWERLELGNWVGWVLLCLDDP